MHAAILEEELEYAFNRLNSNEQMQANNYRFPSDANRFITGRYLFREYFVRYLDNLTSAVTIEYNKAGKPIGKTIESDRTVFCSMSGCGDIFAFAFSDAYETGVDIEVITYNDNNESVLRRCFSEHEVQQVLHSPVKRETMFTVYWTRREALLKAIGCGWAGNTKEYSVYSDVIFGDTLFPIEQQVNGSIRKAYTATLKCLEKIICSVVCMEQN